MNIFSMVDIFLIVHIFWGLLFTSRWIGIPKSFMDIVCWLFFPIFWTHVIFYLVGKYSNDEDDGGDEEYIYTDILKAVWRPIFSF